MDYKEPFSFRTSGRGSFELVTPLPRRISLSMAESAVNGL